METSQQEQDGPRARWRPAGEASRATWHKGRSPGDAGTIQHHEPSGYHHCGRGQDHPARPEVGPWFEAQHHVDVSAEPLYAWGKERDKGSAAAVSAPKPGACSRLADSPPFPVPPWGQTPYHRHVSPPGR